MLLDVPYNIVCTMLNTDKVPSKLLKKLEILDNLCKLVGGRLESTEVLAQEVFNYNMNNSCSFTQ